MDYNSALSFLKANRPMPPDAELNESDANTFDEVRKFFAANPDPVCIPLFLHSFGDGLGFGVYQLCDDVFRRYDQSQLTPHIIDALGSVMSCTRWWAAHWAMDFPDPIMLEALRDVQTNPDDSDAHFFALAAIGSIWHLTSSPDAKLILEERLRTETDSQLTELCDDILHS